MFDKIKRKKNIKKEMKNLKINRTVHNNTTAQALTLNLMKVNKRKLNFRIA